MVASMYAAVNGYMDDIPVDRVRDFESSLIGFLETSKAEILQSIQDQKDIDDATEKALQEAINSVKKTFS